MSSDTLTVTSRNFFERTKAKLWQSVVVASAGLMLLGFCAISGGEAKANNEYLDRKGNDDHTDSAYGALASGYGFASFVFIVAAILLTMAAVYISPLICGSNNERKMIRSPQEIDTGYTAYSENPAAASTPMGSAPNGV